MGELSGVIRFGWWREYNAVIAHLFRGDAIILSETPTEATDKVSAELSEEYLQLFGNDAAFIFTTCP